MAGATTSMGTSPGGIFISYRRQDTAGTAGRLFDRLTEAFGSSRVFLDIEDIGPGPDFVQRVDEAVGSASVLIALIGDRWEGPGDGDGRRIDDPEDLVRVEIASALRRGIAVIPVLVKGAVMPQASSLPDELRPLARRNALELDHARFEFDVERLVEAIRGELETSPQAQERKRVTVLACELLPPPGSTDPEDFDRLLRTYRDLVRRVVDRYDGVLERFSGDDALAVFGAPRTHEDDPERAVRAALEVVEFSEELPALKEAEALVRCGVSTGEVLVRLGIEPGSGDGFVTGKVIAETEELRAAAPPMGVLVDESTYEATSIVFDYQGPSDAPGEHGYLAEGSRARFGTDLIRIHASPFVGRETDLALLQGVFDKVVASSSVQLVTVVGEPGIGKSRIVAQLLGYADSLPFDVVWRQGRCLPYGESVAFWALGEIVKAHAGILESDSPETAVAKLDPVLPAGPEHGWFRERLLPLLGIEAASTAEREELFTAWRRFLESLAEEDPVVLVFEDLHWADEAMLSFLEHLADAAGGVPLMIVATTRPELFDRRPDYASGLRNVHTINLGPLTEDETARLLSSLLGAGVLPADLERLILERSGGNPLYAEEFVRLLKDRGLLVGEGENVALVEGATMPLPDSVQGLIAARLDTLALERKAVLADAAVIGKVFWAAAVARIGDRSIEGATEALRALSRQEFVRPVRRSTMEGEDEYAFWHVLTRDVAYAQLPRVARMEKHVAAATWIEAKAGERVEDLAEILAHHYSTALELARAAGEEERAASLEAPALRFLALAGERVVGLDTGAAFSAFERALALAPEGHPMRPTILVALAKTLRFTGRPARVRELLEEAIAGPDPLQAAQAKLELANSLDDAGGSSDDGLDLVARAVTDLEALDPGPELAEAYAIQAAWYRDLSRDAEAIAWADKSLALSDRLGLPIDPLVLRVRGPCRWFMGDPEGLDDLRLALSLAREHGRVRDEVLSRNELANGFALLQGPADAIDEIDAGIDLARRSGHRDLMQALEVTRRELLYPLGRWDELLADVAEDENEDPDDVPVWVTINRRISGCAIAIWRDDLTTAQEVAGDLAETIEPLEAQWFVPGTDVLAHLALARGDTAGVVDMLGGLEAHPEARGSWNYPVWLPELTRIAVAAGAVDLADRLADGLPEEVTEIRRVAMAMTEAQLAEARGEFERAAERYAVAEEGWRAFSVPELAQALLGRGRCLLALGDPSADAVLGVSREVFVSLDAERFLREVDAHLERAVP